jgi:aspartyl/asparaginyl beta-hydroxylase (cupin superfamily)
MSRTQGFLDPTDYPFVEAFERNAPLIHGELVEVMNTHPSRTFRHRPDGGNVVFEEGWKVFGFYERGRKLSLPPSICPRTRELVDTVPDIVTAGFSKFAGGARVKPHSGKRDLIRCHLGLIISPGCRFRVGDEVREWEVNKCLLFNNRVVHEAWNDSQEDRVILIVDFVYHRGAEAASRDVGTAT